jgi:hypothetical protein
VYVLATFVVTASPLLLFCICQLGFLEQASQQTFHMLSSPPNFGTYPDHYSLLKNIVQVLVINPYEWQIYGLQAPKFLTLTLLRPNTVRSESRCVLRSVGCDTYTAHCWPVDITSNALCKCTATFRTHCIILSTLFWVHHVPFFLKIRGHFEYSYNIF